MVTRVFKTMFLWALCFCACSAALYGDSSAHLPEGTAMDKEELVFWSHNDVEGVPVIEHETVPCYNGAIMNSYMLGNTKHYRLFFDEGSLFRKGDRQ